MTIAMRVSTFVAAACLVLAAAAGRSNADTYSVDKPHTNITFSWNHLGIARQSARLIDCAGQVEFDPEAPEAGSVAVTMKVASLWTGVDLLDKQLKSADFFDAAQFPTITFTSTAVKKTGDRSGEVTGDLNIMGRARPVTLAVTWNFTGEHPWATLNPLYRDKFVSGFTATTKILRSDWGITRGTPLTSDEIEITINTELLRK